MDIKKLLRIATQQGASDLHLSPGLPPMLRINGDLVAIPHEPVLDSAATAESIHSMLEPSQKQQLITELELDFAFLLPDFSCFRVNVFHQLNGIAAVFRIIPSDVPTFGTLNLPDVFKQLIDLPHGLILVTGATGSGKSTTLAAMVGEINTQQACHIITIEDPIEFIHHSKKSIINQRQVHRDTHTFANALRSALREDPDVILVGELRDLETVRLALTAAETGHLVMATLHTNSAPRAVNRIIDIFPGSEKNVIRNMLSESLQAVICQTLVKAKAGGRVAAFEIMLGVPAIRNLIREDKVAQMLTTIQTGREKGMCTLQQSLQDLTTKNII